jgi:hypothetical protein
LFGGRIVINIQELIEWNNKLTKLLNEKEQGEGTLSWSMMVEEHLKEFIDKWNDHPVILKLMKAYIESEAERIYWNEGYGKGSCTWFNVGGLRKEPFFDKAREKLGRIIEEPDLDKQVVVINKKQLARLESIVKELAEGVSYNHTDGFQYCAYCDGFQNDHDVDCLIVRARKVMEMNP